MAGPLGVAFEHSKHLATQMAADVVSCRASSVRLEVAGEAEPTEVPGCGCIAAAGAVAMYMNKRQCGLCKSDIDDLLIPEPVRRSTAACEVIRDINSGQMPMLTFSHMNQLRFPHQRNVVHACSSSCKSGNAAERGRGTPVPVVHRSHCRWLGAVGTFRIGQVPVNSGGRTLALQTITFPVPDTQSVYATVHGLFAQHRASMVSAGVAGIAAVDWQTSAVRIAMPAIKETLRACSRGLDFTCSSLYLLLDIFRRVASTVRDLHRHGLVHCGISPSSIMLDNQLRPLLTDFSRSRRHTQPQYGRLGVDLTRCAALGCVNTHSCPHEMQGHVCAAVDVHDLGQTFSSVAKQSQCEAAPGSDPQEPEVTVIRKLMFDQISQMIQFPHRTSLIKAATTFQGLRSDVMQLKGIDAAQNSASDAYALKQGTEGQAPVRLFRAKLHKLTARRVKVCPRFHASCALHGCWLDAQTPDPTGCPSSCAGFTDALSHCCDTDVLQPMHKSQASTCIVHAAWSLLCGHCRNAREACNL